MKSEALGSLIVLRQCMGMKSVSANGRAVRVIARPSAVTEIPARALLCLHARYGRHILHLAPQPSASTLNFTDTSS
jgi:hypothetical protein